jgi:hypothetical protein
MTVADLLKLVGTFVHYPLVGHAAVSAAQKREARESRW